MFKKLLFILLSSGSFVCGMQKKQKLKEELIKELIEKVEKKNAGLQFFMLASLSIRKEQLKRAEKIGSIPLELLDLIGAYAREDCQKELSEIKDFLRHETRGSIINQLKALSRGAQKCINEDLMLFKVIPNGFSKINKMLWSPNGDDIAILSDKNPVRILNSKSGKYQIVWPMNYLLADNALWSSDGKIAVLSGCNIHIFDIEKGQEIQHFDLWSAKDLGWSCDGKILTAIDSSRRSKKAFDVETGKKLKILQGHKEYIDDIKWHPNKKLLAICSMNKIYMLDILKKKYLKHKECESEKIDWSPDGNYLASYSKSREICIWKVFEKDELTFELVKKMSQEKGCIQGMSWDFESKKLATVTDCGSILLWDIKSGKYSTIFDGQLSKDQQKVLSCNPKKHQIASLYSNSIIGFWEPCTFEDKIKNNKEMVDKYLLKKNKGKKNHGKYSFGNNRSDNKRLLYLT